MPNRSTGTKAGTASRAGSSTITWTTPGMNPETASQVNEILQDRLNSIIDLSLTLKHVHWNVVGPTFIGVHKMLDEQVNGVRLMVDNLAERIATLGGEPNGLPGYVATNRGWDDYNIGRATAMEHLGALDMVYDGVIASHRHAIEDTEQPDPVSQDLLIQQTGELEKYHWFVRAHLEDAGGRLRTQGAATEEGAAKQASQSTSR